MITVELFIYEFNHAKMDSEFPHVEHLTNEELDYELFIRGRIDDISDDDEANCRLLERLFWEDARMGRGYDSPYTIDQEYDYVSVEIEDLCEQLSEGLDERAVS